MNTKIFRWKPNSGENHRCRRLSLQNFIIKKTSYNMYWCRLIPARRHPPVEGYNLLSLTNLTWKGATTPCTRLPASPGREPLPPDIHTSLYWQKASSFRLKASTLRFTRFLQQICAKSSSLFFRSSLRFSFIDLEILNLLYEHRCTIDFRSIN